MKYKTWSREDEQFLIHNNQLLAEEVAKALGTTKEAVHGKRHRMREKGELPYINRSFTPEEDFYIRLSDETLSVIGKKLERSWRSIAQRRRQLGVSKKYKKGE